MKNMLLVVSAGVHISCGSGSPTAPQEATPPENRFKDLIQQMPAGGRSAGVGATNEAPSLVLRTRPEAQPGTPHPVVTGTAPFEVSFNLCRSSDPDADDSINWQFHFGDDGTEAFAADGTFNANFARSCRANHTYGDGRFTATVSVTDKHLEDQARGVGATARRIERVTILASATGSPTAPASPTTFTTQTIRGSLPSQQMFPNFIVDLYEIAAVPGTSLTVRVDTVSPADTFDPVYALYSALPAVFFSPDLFRTDDDNFDCTFPPPMGRCPMGTFALPADPDSTYYLMVLGSGFVGATGGYVLTVNSSAPIGALTLVQDDVTVPAF